MPADRWVWSLVAFEDTVNPIKLETGLRPNRAGIPYTLLLRVEHWVSNFWASTVEVDRGVEG